MRRSSAPSAANRDGRLSTVGMDVRRRRRRQAHGLVMGQESRAPPGRSAPGALSSMASEGGGARVQIAAVGAGGLGEHGHEDEDEDGEQEFHDAILIAGVDKSKHIWLNE